MASNGTMSDEEIRRKLKEHNINIPLTESTRKILLEKIKNISEGKKSPARNSTVKSKASRRTISHFSSGEDETESDEDANKKKKTTKMPPPSTTQRSTRRQTIGSLVPSTTKAEPSPTPTSAFLNPKPLTPQQKAISPNVTIRRPRSASRADDYDKGSDSDSPVVVSPPQPSRRTLPRLADLNKSNRIDNEVDDIINSSRFLNRLSNITDYVKRDDDEDDGVASRSLLSYRTPSESPTPFVSDFTRGISRRFPGHSFTTSKSHLDDSAVSRASSNGSFASASGDDDASSGLWSSTHTVSAALVALAVVFFAALAVVYLNMHGSEVAPRVDSASNYHIPSCVSDDPNELCLTDEQLSVARSLVKLVKPEVERRSIASVCGPAARDGSYLSATMSNKELTDWLTEVHAMSLSKATDGLRALRMLVRANPQLGLATTSPLRDGHSSDDARLAVEAGGLVATGGVLLPVTCKAKKVLAALVTAALVVTGVCLSVAAAYRCTAWWRQRRADEEARVFELVQGAVDAVQAACAHSPACKYLAVNHVRDLLIAPRDRPGMASTWNKAVKFVEANESRLRREVQVVSGEECPVWRWLPEHSSPSQEQGEGSRSKQWHGQAFGTEPGAQNGAPQSPTPCLKLRHMFDDTEFGDAWETKVCDALLHKCGDRARVLHMHVDRASSEGCVYMKLASKEDAGIAYRALHGWWFDSRLVTVKYLRLERYHERFPDAVNARVPLKPSSDEAD